MSDKHKLSAAEMLMRDSHRTIAQLKGMVPELIKQRDAAQKGLEHWQSQATFISHSGMSVALDNERLRARITHLESLLPIELRGETSEVSVVQGQDVVIVGESAP